MNHDQYSHKFNAKWGSEYELISEYKGSANKIKMRHIRCGTVIEKSAYEALRYGCATCSRKNNIRYAHQASKDWEAAFIERLHKKFGAKYNLIGQYVDAKTTTRLRCECGREFNVRPDDLLYGPRDCNCAYWKARVEKKTRPPKPKPEPFWTHDKYVSKVKEIWGDEFEVIGKFSGMGKKIEVIHKSCGQSFEKSADSLIKGHGCLACSRSGESGGTILIKKVLDDLGLKYNREVKLPGCKYINQLLFDFAIYNNQGEIALLIECDGEHHFRPKQRTGGIEKLHRVQKRDQVKNEYCQRNGLPLLRLKYTIVRGNNAYEKVRKRIEDGIVGKL